jgi:hypothetical protein
VMRSRLVLTPDSSAAADDDADGVGGDANDVSDPDARAAKTL